MDLAQKLTAVLAGCILTMTWWICAPLLAKQPPPASDVAAETFAKGPLPPRVAEQVRTIVTAQFKASLPHYEAGAVAVARLDTDTCLNATVDGQTYSAKVFHPFLVEALSPTEYGAKEYYVRTAAPWRLKADLVIPADIYLSGIGERVSAYDADMIAAQRANIAASEKLCKAALEQLKAIAVAQPAKETAVRAIFQKHQKRILAGGTIDEEEMSADYESVLGQPLMVPHDSVVNGDFGRLEAGMPLGWEYVSFRPSNSSASVVEDDHAPRHRALLIENKELDDTRLIQGVTLAPGARYELTGRIKTQDITCEKECGAYLWIEGDVHTNWLTGRCVTGTQDWRQFTVEISTPAVIKPDSSLSVECRLGTYGDEAKGKAWFGDVKLRRIR